MVTERAVDENGQLLGFNVKICRLADGRSLRGPEQYKPVEIRAANLNPLDGSTKPLSSTVLAALASSRQPLTPATAKPAVPTPAAPVVHPSAVQAPTMPTSVPTGYNPTLARTLARQVVTDVRSKSYNYNRTLVSQFQAAAGIKVDGIYGGSTVGAMKYFGADRAPKALFAPYGEVPYTPPA
jgi:murein L,D-transpeptidase YcbB/YkuD